MIVTVTLNAALDRLVCEFLKNRKNPLRFYGICGNCEIYFKFLTPGFELQVARQHVFWFHNILRHHLL
mgnify:CR=1 FL=1